MDDGTHHVNAFPAVNAERDGHCEQNVVRGDDDAIRFVFEVQLTILFHLLIPPLQLV